MSVAVDVQIECIGARLLYYRGYDLNRELTILHIVILPFRREGEKVRR